jgi:hypothetical protein
MAVKKALEDTNPARELRWAAFLQGETQEPEKKKAPARKASTKAAPMAGV